MRHHHHLIARGLARAIQAGPLTGHGMRARARQCFGPRLWLDAVVQGLLDRPRSKWMRLELGDLARLIETDVNFQSAFFAHEPPRLRRYILRSPTTQGLPPLALEDAGLPLLPTPGDVARCLGITPAGLWRLSLPSAWQRRRPLGEQHYRCRLTEPLCLGFPQPWPLNYR